MSIDQPSKEAADGWSKELRGHYMTWRT